MAIHDLDLENSFVNSCQIHDLVLKEGTVLYSEETVLVVHVVAVTVIKDISVELWRVVVVVMFMLRVVLVTVIELLDLNSSHALGDYRLLKVADAASVRLVQTRVVNHSI